MLQMARKKPKSNKKGDPARDQCQTPEYALWPLLPYLDPSKTVWEPCRGEGYLVLALKNNDIPNIVSGDILTGQDFFVPKHEPESWDILITNPPYSIKYGFLERCYSLGKPFALLLPSDALFSKTAKVLFRKHGVDVLNLEDRVNYKMPYKGWDGDGAQFHSSWFTWGLGVRPQGFTEPVYMRLAEIRNPRQLKLF
jgi:hypothetical protein